MIRKVRNEYSESPYNQTLIFLEVYDLIKKSICINIQLASVSILIWLLVLSSPDTIVLHLQKIKQLFYGRSREMDSDGIFMVLFYET